MKKRIPKADPPRIDPEIEKRKLLFECNWLRLKGKFSQQKGTSKKIERLKNKLQEYMELTLEQFRQHPGAKLKIYTPQKNELHPPQRLSQDIKNTPIWRFRINNKIRVLGYMEDNVFLIIWVDWEHQTGSR